MGVGIDKHLLPRPPFQTGNCQHFVFFFVNRMAFNDFVFICFFICISTCCFHFQNKNLFDSLNILCYCPLSLSSLTAFLFLKL